MAPTHENQPIDVHCTRPDRTIQRQSPTWPVGIYYTSTHHLRRTEAPPAQTSPTTCDDDHHEDTRPPLLSSDIHDFCFSRSSALAISTLFACSFATFVLHAPSHFICDSQNFPLPSPTAISLLFQCFTDLAKPATQEGSCHMRTCRCIWWTRMDGSQDMANGQLGRPCAQIFLASHAQVPVHIYQCNTRKSAPSHQHSSSRHFQATVNTAR